ncbi:MAG: antitoxin [Desulfurellales bacterium]|nr:MAG: antitoxin [Desulfurellales bacterium]
MAVEYIVLCGQIVGSEKTGFDTVYGFDGKRYADRAEAIKDGFKIRESDDFNIGVVKNGKLTSIDWMEQVVDTEPKLMKKIANQIGL